MCALIKNNCILFIPQIKCIIKLMHGVTCPVYIYIINMRMRNKLKKGVTNVTHPCRLVKSRL